MTIQDRNKKIYKIFLNNSLFIIELLSLSDMGYEIVGAGGCVELPKT